MLVCRKHAVDAGRFSSQADGIEMKHLAQSLPQSGPTILQRLHCCQKQAWWAGLKELLSNRLLFFKYAHTLLYAESVCVRERSWLRVWPAHVSAGDLPSPSLRLLLMFPRAELPGVLPSKQEDFYRLRVATRETVRCFHVKDAYCALGTQSEIKRKETLFPVDETDV